MAAELGLEEGTSTFWLHLLLSTLHPLRGAERRSSGWSVAVTPGGVGGCHSCTHSSIHPVSKVLPWARLGVRSGWQQADVALLSL